MTEIEAIEIHIAENIHRIEVIEDFMHSNSDAKKETCSKNISVLTKINGLLREIQQYREIGTVEGYKRAVKVSKENYYLCAEYKARLKEYEAIGTVDECREAVERMKPKKMLNSGERIPFSWYCPNCREELTDDGYKYDDECCYHCGQAIDKS